MKKFTRIFIALLIVTLYSGYLMAQTQDASPFAPTTKPIVNQTDATWDVLFSFPTANGGEQGIESDGSYLYTCKWGSASNAYFNKYSTAGVKLDSFSITGVTSGIRDLAWGGGFMWGGKNGTGIYKMDWTAHTLVSTVTAGIAAVRNLSYDPTANSGAGGLWAGGWSDLNLLTLTGSLVSTAPATGLTGMYGTAYDGITPGGPYLWIHDQSGGAGTPQLLQQFKISTGSLTGVTHDISDVPGFDATTAIAGGCGSNVGIVAGKLVLLGNIQQTPNLVYGYELAIANNVNGHESIENIVKVFPNPANEMINIKSGIYVIDNVSVTNNIGQLVYEAGSNGTNSVQINSSNWVEGIYFVNVQTVEGTKTYKVAVK